MMTALRATFILLVAVLAIGVTACGSDDDGGDAEAPTTAEGAAPGDDAPEDAALDEACLPEEEDDNVATVVRTYTNCVLPDEPATAASSSGDPDSPDQVVEVSGFFDEDVALEVCAVASGAVYDLLGLDDAELLVARIEEDGTGTTLVTRVGADGTCAVG